MESCISTYAFIIYIYDYIYRYIDKYIYKLMGEYDKHGPKIHSSSPDDSIMISSALLGNSHLKQRIENQDLPRNPNFPSHIKQWLRS